MTSIAHVSPFSIRLDKEKRNRLDLLAKAHERTSHALAIKTIDEYLEKEEAWLAYEQQAIKAYESLQLTGLHVGHNELKQWANSLDSTSQQKVLGLNGVTK